MIIKYRISKIVLFMLFVLFLGCPSPLPNNAPYPIIALFTSVEYEEDSGFQIFQLDIEEQGGLSDPDGDKVYYKSSLLPSWITLDVNTGVVTVDTVDAHSSEAFLFWSEDEYGADTSDDPFTITISVAVGNQPPYAVIGPSEKTLYPGMAAPQTVTLITAAPGLELDPDGDSVTFGSSTLPSYAVLNATTGVITVINAPYATFDEVITVWTVDEYSLRSVDYTATLHFTIS